MHVDGGQKVYALIEIGADGYAKFNGVGTSPTEKGPYLTARVDYVSGADAHLLLPIDHYYMEESVAPAAEKAYREKITHGQSKNIR